MKKFILHGIERDIAEFDPPRKPVTIAQGYAPLAMVLGFVAACVVITVLA